MTLKLYNDGKLDRPRMSDGFLADSVDTTLWSTVYTVFGKKKPGVF